MKFTRIILVITTALLSVALLSQCDPKEAAVYPPEGQFFVTPTQGNTTTTFRFNTDQSENPGTNDTMLFFRWDWNGDGEWDTHFSRSRVFDHRFWLKGTYNVIMEASNNGGLRDTISTLIEVVQGYSAPHPKLHITPGSGHIRTEFVLDASATTDDEDSLNTLQFRWDFEGDGFFDTPWASESTITHRYLGPDRYGARVAVRDPKGLEAEAIQVLFVTLNNPRLVADFSWTPENGSSADVFRFDATASHDPDEPGNRLKYRWDFNGDDVFDTEYSSDPVIEHQFEDEGDATILLEVMDQYGLTNHTSKELVVAHANRPPKANFFAGTDYGNLTTNFYFDASGVRDDEDWDYQLRVRWDFNSDGVWDTPYSNEKTVYHKYGQQGEFTCTMEVIDLGGLTASASTTVRTTGGTNETGIIIDTDSGDTYGTVKLGNQWWMAENLKNTTNRSCYGNSTANCETYGALYNWTNAMAGSNTEKARGLCPAGWHIPTITEWETLFNFLGGEEVARTQLEEGGVTDFNMKYAGQITTSGVSQFAGSVTNFWTSSEAAGDNAWAFSLQKDKDQIWKLSLGKSYRNSVRCVKN